MMDGMTNMILWIMIKTMMFSLERPTMRMTPNSKLFDSIESMSSE